MTQSIDNLSEMLKPLGDPLRLSLLNYLADGNEHCVCEMAEAFSEPEFNISRKLAPLRKLGLICARREGTWMYYHLCQDRCSELLSAFSSALGISAELLRTSPLSILNSQSSIKSRSSCLTKSKSSCCVPETPAAVKWPKAGRAPSKAIRSKSGRRVSKSTA